MNLKVKPASGTPDVVIEHADWRAFFTELQKESDRSVPILAVAWIEHILKEKLAKLFSKGNADARKSLFGTNGPFATFSSKCSVVFCYGLIDGDIFHDLGVLRKIRNLFAHHIQGLSLASPEVVELFDKLRLPHRHYHDWGQLKCAATKEGTGILLYTGEKPDDAGDDLVISHHGSFRWAVSIVLTELVSMLGVGIRVPDDFKVDED
jgi:hypothetical protein